MSCRAIRGLTDTSNETGQNRHELRKAANNLLDFDAFERCDHQLDADGKCPAV